MQNRALRLPKTLAHFIFYFIRQQKLGFLIIQFFSFALVLEQAVFPYMFGRIIDGISRFAGDKSTAWHTLQVPLFQALGLWILIQVLFRFGGFIQARIIPVLEQNVRMSMLNYVLHHSPSFFANQFAGNIANKISDMPINISAILYRLITIFIPALITLCVVLYLFSTISPLFATLLFIWIIAHMGIAIGFGTISADYSLLHSESRSVLNGRIVDSLTNYLTIKLFARIQNELAYIFRFQEEERERHIKTWTYTEKVRSLLSFLSILGPALTFNGYAFYCWQQGSISVGEVVMVFQTSWNILTLAWWTGSELPDLFKEIGFCQQALVLIQAPFEIRDMPYAPDLSVTKGEISFKNVTFFYRGPTPLFESLNVTIPGGQKVGLVGFSGSGKTTFINLILRLFDIQAGEIFIDGQDISKVTQESLRASISMIPQDPTLFHRTLMENIRYGCPTAPDHEVIEAAKKAHAHEFIMELAQGYNSHAGERGIKVSGGQRQRIAIARAILKNAPILMLDEATSALDSVTEKMIQDSLQHLMKDKTTLVIAHRLSTLLNMDRILVFHKGQILEDGPHNVLIKKKDSLYKKLWETQAGGMLSEEVDKNSNQNLIVKG